MKIIYTDVLVIGGGLAGLRMAIGAKRRGHEAIILSLVPPVILTMLEYGWQRAVIILAGFVVLNFIVDNLVKPRFMQSGLDVPPLLGLLSLVIWGYLLGASGALLALPLTIALRRVLREAPETPPATQAA